jgi:DNA-binding transcriptional ArsR family regulator
MFCSPIKLAETSGVIGDPARAVMLCALLDGRAHGATELALTAGVSPQTASWHLAKLSDGTLVTAQKKGRNRYFRMASPLVAQAVEAMMAVAITGSPLSRSRVLSEREQTLRTARTCYDHLAGKLGVALIEAFTRRKLMCSRRMAGSSARAEQSCFPTSASICPPCSNRSVRFADYASIGASKSHILRGQTTRHLLRGASSWIGCFQEQFGVTV